MKSARQIAVEIDTMNEQIEIARAANHMRYVLMADSANRGEPLKDAVSVDTNRVSMLENTLKGSRMYIENAKATSRYGQLMAFLDTFPIANVNSIVEALPSVILNEYRGQLKSKVSVIRSTIDRNDRTIKRLELSKRKYTYELHWKFSLAVACIIMLLIGGPMGTIVRKGGFGYPLLVSIFFFTFFLMANISCKKLNDAEKLPPVLAAWMPVMLLFIISIVLTYKALQDAKMMDLDRLKARWQRWRTSFKWKPA